MESSFQTSVLVDEVVDEIPGVLVLQFPLPDSGFGEKLFEFGVFHGNVESLVGIPSHVADVFEVGRQTDILLLQLGLLFLLAAAAVGVSCGLLLLVVLVCRHVGRVGCGRRRRGLPSNGPRRPRLPRRLRGQMGAPLCIGDRRLPQRLDAAVGSFLSGHPALLPQPPFSQLVLNDLVEVDRLVVVREIESNLSVICLEGVEIRPWRLVLELVIDFLVKDQGAPVHVHHADVVRAPGVVLDQAGHPAATLVPSRVRRRLRPVDLDDGGGKGSAARSDQPLGDPVLLGRQQDRLGRLAGHAGLPLLLLMLLMMLIHFGQSFTAEEVEDEPYCEAEQKVVVIGKGCGGGDDGGGALSTT